jgi:HK97 family phage prohead protease
VVTRDKDRVEIRTPLLDQIDPNVPNVVTYAQTIEDLIFEGISWWQVTSRMAGPNGRPGFPRTAVHLDVNSVSLEPPFGNGFQQNRTLPSGQRLPGGTVWVNGLPFPGRDMIRFDSPNPGILTAAARSIRRAILLEKAATLYAEDPQMLDYFTPTEGADPIEDDDVQEILDEWRSAREERSTGYVPAALKYNQVQMPSPRDLQLVELQRQSSIELANAMGLDAEDLQVSTTSRTYQNATDRRRDRINDTLAPYMRAITDRLGMNDVTRRGQHVAFDLDEYMRADPNTRWNTYQIGLASNIVSVEEVREAEGLPAIPIEPVRPVQEDPMDEEVSASVEADAQFSEEDGVNLSFALEPADAEFRVNRDKRTISGLLVPWNKTAGDNMGLASWRFSKNSLNWSDASRVKLNRDHDRRQAIGVSTRLQNTPLGVDGSFRIARGEEGDKVLSLAEDGVLDGFSIEANFAKDGSSWARDPDDDLVRVVRSAQLVGVAITASPAYDDARVSSVAATRKDNTVTKTTVDPNAKGEVENKDNAGEVQLTAEATTAFTAAVEAFNGLTGGLTEAVQNLVQVQQTNGEGPAVVDPTKRMFQVNEEKVYRFDGTMGKHDFSQDIIKGAKGDYESLSRAQTWISQHFGAAFVDTTDVATLNPVRQRPDMYVDELQFPTPLWDSIRKGTIEDNTPFVLPKFASDSGLVGDHTEGVEPAAGTFVTTSQTITPSPVSGRVEVTREAWDQGGNPQLSTLLWRQMNRKYFEALEEAAAALLESISATEIVLTVAAVDEALASEVKSALAALHFVRGGFRFRDFKLEQGLYTALADATDSNGRPLFPVLGAQNTDGTMGQFFGAINIAGLAGQPAWALPFTDGAANSSYLYDREDVHGWASNPQRLDFQYRVAFVDVAIWGYKALAATRESGVRRIEYDNAV